MNNYFPEHKKQFLFASLIILVISICFSWWMLVPKSPPLPATPRVYFDALKDVEQVRSERISTGLTAIVKDNPLIQWQGDRLKVASFTNHKYEVGSTEPQSRELWVTVVPELQNFCRDYTATGNEPIPRIIQLLGLPPTEKRTQQIVEFWVNYRDLFRPTPDPEISDREAQLTFPESRNFLLVSDEYKNWYNDRVREFDSRLKEMNPAHLPAPWTRLGYTYDWGESNDHIGLSEFVLVKGADLEVASATPVNDYCRGNNAIASSNVD